MEGHRITHVRQVNLAPLFSLLDHTTEILRLRSLSIESQFTHIDAFKDTVLYLNDDYFITRPLNAGAFATPLYGPVFRIQRSWNIGLIDIQGWYDYTADMEGEQVKSIQCS